MFQNTEHYYRKYLQTNSEFKILNYGPTLSIYSFHNSQNEKLAGNKLISIRSVRLME